MDERIMNELVPIIEKTREGILKGVEIAQEQMPDLINQVYKWNFTISLIWFIVGVVALLLFIRFITSLVKIVKENIDKPSWEDPLSVRTILNAIGAVLSVFFIPNLFSNIEWLQILVAPKLFLLDYISKLIK